MGIKGFVCGPRLYEYRGWFFEVNPSSGPWPLTKDGEPRKRAGNKFFKAYEKFQREPNKEKFRVGGGCIPLEEKSLVAWIYEYRDGFHVAEADKPVNPAGKAYKTRKEALAAAAESFTYAFGEGTYWGNRETRKISGWKKKQ